MANVTWLFHNRYNEPSYYNPINHEVNIYLHGYTTCSLGKITDKDTITLMTAEIEHEIIHAVLDEICDDDTSKRFDFIARGLFSERAIKICNKVLHVTLMTKQQVAWQYGIILKET